MPIIKVTLMEGYDGQTVQRLSKRLTDAVRSTISAPLDGITVVAEEVKPTSYMRGGRARTPGPPAKSATEIARAFLQLMEARDIEKAMELLDPGFAMVFPSGKRMTELQDLVAWSKTRYQSVRKSFDGWDEAFDEERAIVWCRGTLSGEWLDGNSFEGIRFVDRFEVQNGRITRQDVWNDMAEFRST